VCVNFSYKISVTSGEEVQLKLTITSHAPSKSGRQRMNEGRNMAFLENFV
jgi:hypothetical protein